jgi:hypothetical protein
LIDIPQDPQIPSPQLLRKASDGSMLAVMYSSASKIKSKKCTIKSRKENKKAKHK